MCNYKQLFLVQVSVHRHLSENGLCILDISKYNNNENRIATNKCCQWYMHIHSSGKFKEREGTHSFFGMHVWTKTVFLFCFILGFFFAIHDMEVCIFHCCCLFWEPHFCHEIVSWLSVSDKRVCHAVCESSKKHWQTYRSVKHECR